MAKVAETATRARVKEASWMKIRLFLGFRQWNAFHMQECLPYQGTLKGWIKWILVDLKPLKD